MRNYKYFCLFSAPFPSILHCPMRSDFWALELTLSLSLVKLGTMKKPLEFLIIAIIATCLGSQVRSDASDHRYNRGDPVPLYANKVGPFHNPRYSLSLNIMHNVFTRTCFFLPSSFDQYHPVSLIIWFNQLLYLRLLFVHMLWRLFFFYQWWICRSWYANALNLPSYIVGPLWEDV